MTEFLFCIILEASVAEMIKAMSIKEPPLKVSVASSIFIVSCFFVFDFVLLARATEECIFNETVNVVITFGEEMCSVEILVRNW